MKHVFFYALLSIFNGSLENTVASEIIQTPHVKISLLSEKEGVSFEDPQTFAIHFELEPGWHIYSKNPGPTGYPPQADFSQTIGGQFSELDFPEPEKIKTKNQISFGYEKAVTLFTKFTPNEELKKNKDLNVILHLKWLICKTECVPEKGVLTLNLPIVTSKQLITYSSTHSELFKKSTPSKLEISQKDVIPMNSSSPLWLMIIFSFLGGILLNFMPCVLPVLSLKILSLLKEKQAKKKAIAYTAGVLISFLILAAIIVFVKSTGSSIGWGFQLQNPYFIFFLTLLFFILGLNLLGFFEWSGSFMGVGHSLANKEGLWGSFFTGVLTTIAATPCSAPFMGTALGFALSQNAFIIFIIFISLGLGLSLPFLLVSFIPAFSRLLPKPGNWMNSFKEFLAFPLFITSLWLMTILFAQTNFKVIFFLLECAFSIVFWIWFSKKTPKFKWVLAFVILCLFVVENKKNHLTSFTSDKKISDSNELKKPWKKWSRALMNEAIESGKTVFIDTTAEWCVACKANESAVFSNEKIISLLSEENTVALVADWTNGEEDVTQLLEENGRNSVPAYFLFKNKNKTPKILPQVFTVDQFIEEIKKND